MSFKIAASDFDGTLAIEQEVSRENLLAIKSWRAAGNKFGIVTGRFYNMLTPLLEKFGLDVDFAICCNGAIIHDGAGKVIFETGLPKKILPTLLSDSAVEKTFHFLFVAADEVFCTGLKENSWLLRARGRLNFSMRMIDAAQVETLPKINQLSLIFATPEEAQLAADNLNRKYGDEIFAQKNTYSLDIVPAGISKASGVENLLRLMNWHGAVYVIGDEANDLPMIKHFGGYTVTGAKDFVKREAVAIFDSVGAMLKNFLDKS